MTSPRGTMVSTGLFPSSKIGRLAFDRPFIQQAYVVFTANALLVEALRALKTQYHTSRGPLAEVLAAARELDQQHSSDLHALSTPNFIPDVWSFSRGTLSLNASKDVHESLGIPDENLSNYFRGIPPQYLCNIHTRSPREKTRTVDFIQDSFARWDRTRQEIGLGDWEFAFHTSSPEVASGPLSPSRSQTHDVEPTIHTLTNVHVPCPSFTSRPSASTKAKAKSRSAKKRAADADMDMDDPGADIPEEVDEGEAVEDWNAEMSELFEWVGMAILGAQRLQANDRVDPYVAVYSPPQPSRTGDLTHISWRGFLPPAFVQRIVDTVISHLPQSDAPHAFAALTLHEFPSAPLPRPVRVPDIHGEDTLSVLLVPEAGLGEATVKALDFDNMCPHQGGEWSSAKHEKEEKVQLIGRWAMVESVGKRDARFG
ncbi:ribonuclease P 40kDa subunit-domain-containing protein [Amylostereum chailletii]|nr:ribonuclease P 40kDa subunit-domain-containing protein [Amylostereum chailletii]